MSGRHIPGLDDSGSDDAFDESAGIVGRALEYILASVHGSAATVFLSYLEIYNEQIHDLLLVESAPARQAAPPARDARVKPSSRLGLAVKHATSDGQVPRPQPWGTGQAAVRTLSYPLHTPCTPWGHSAPSVRWAAGRGHFVRLSAQVNVENLTQVSVNNVAEASRLIARGNQQRMVRPRAAYTARRRCCGRLARALGTSLRSGSLVSLFAVPCHAAQ
jgi:hypothetical protein